MNFVDYVKIYAKSGKGGDGHISFRKEKFVPRGGPDGGNGGKGGDVVAIADPQLYTLLDFRYHRRYIANDGDKGAKNNRSGKNGRDSFIKVPVGTIIKESDSGEVFADLDKPGKKSILLRGGRGGRGNAEFTTSVRQTPRFAEDGKPGDETELILELKVLADVGLVGFPNAGKSTLISVLSNAKPKIAEYPFTTLQPNLGLVKVSDYSSFTIADIPGLIEGASDGKGLGHQFLRHIERSRVLVFMLEAISEKPYQDFIVLKKELENYNKELFYKKMLVCISKADMVDDSKLKELIQIDFDGLKTTSVSSITHSGLEELKFLLWDELKKEK